MLQQVCKPRAVRTGMAQRSSFKVGKTPANMYRMIGVGFRGSLRIAKSRSRAHGSGGTVWDLGRLQECWRFGFDHD